MVNAADQIRRDLASEAQSRTRRGLALLGLWAVAAVALAIGLGVRADLSAQDGLAAAIAAAFVLFGGLVSFSPSLRFGRWSARAIALVALLSPLLAARQAGDLGAELGGAFGCTATIAALGVLGLVVARLVLGAARRRFGGAPLLEAVGAAMVASLAVGLHCPASTAAHLLTHAVGAFVVAVVVGRLTLGEV